MRTPALVSILMIAVVGVAIVAVFAFVTAGDSDTTTSAQGGSFTYASQAELGKSLFFDTRLSGDTQTSCSSCHLPDAAWTDGEALSRGYTSVLHFRNTPTLLNSSQQEYFFWDGRIDGSDLATTVREHITEAHFMNLDGRLMVERMAQVPEYAEAFEDLFGSEVSFGKILNAIAAYVRTLESSDDNPYKQFTSGDRSALSVSAQAGLELFSGAANCSSCHSGDLLTDGAFYATGALDNPDIFTNPDRHITFRRFFKQFAVGNFIELREDPGLFALTHEAEDYRKFRTPSLLEAARTAPYMHGGSLATLEDVVRFYNDGAGDGPNKDARLVPLGLSEQEISNLVTFLESLGSPPDAVQIPDLPDYDVVELGGGQ